MPIVSNEDDHFDFRQGRRTTWVRPLGCRGLVATSDFRMKAVKLRRRDTRAVQGKLGIRLAAQKAFFALLSQFTGEDSVDI
jgi:hypothetical protein